MTATPAPIHDVRDAEGESAEAIARSLARFPPFRQLGADRVAELAAHARVVRYPTATTVLVQQGEPAHGLFVIKRGAVDLSEEGQHVDRLGEGEVFGLSVLSGLGPALTVRAAAGTECYLIEPEAARELLGSPAGLTFLALTTARWRERDAAERHVRRAGIDGTLEGEIARAPHVGAVVAAADRLPSVVRSLLGASIDPVDIGHVIGVAIDRLTIRMIELHISRAGEPPAPFAWVALGSAARHEQSLTSDQDHAIAYGTDEIEAIDPYFGALARTVADGLEACGVPRCRGNAMAENPAWRRSVGGWQERFTRYVTDPEMMATRVSSIAFDYRRLTGAIDVEPVLDEVIRSARREPAFIRRLVRTALESRPPAGRIRDLAADRRGRHRGTVDLKHGGITIVTNLARCYAIRAGLTENRTLERLRGAASAGAISEERRDSLSEAFRLLWRIRLEHQIRRIELGEPPDDQVDPGTLTTISRRALGAALRTIAEAQAVLAKEEGL